MKKILVIDDEAIVRTSCERALGPAGYEVKVASSGQEGIRCLEEQSYSLVLLDLKMPDIDGMDILRRIRDTWHDTKVIMITGYSTVETAVQSLRHGAFNFIEKPFTPNTLLAAVKEAVE